jgi:hypothetical protein
VWQDFSEKERRMESYFKANSREAIESLKARVSTVMTRRSCVHSIKWPW